VDVPYLKSAYLGKPMLSLREALRLLAVSFILLISSSGHALPLCSGLQDFQGTQSLELEPGTECTFQTSEPRLVIFINYTPKHQKAWLPQIEYAVNGQTVELPTYKFYFIQLKAQDQMSFRNVGTRRSNLYYFAGSYWSLWIWAYCLIASTLGAAIAFAYYFLYRRTAYFHLAFFSLTTALYNMLHPTAFTLNYVLFFVMVSSYFNIVLGFQRPQWNRRIQLFTVGFAALWTLSFSAFPYDINIKISMISSVTGVLILLLSAYNLWKRRRIIISSFALVNTLFIFYLGLAERQHLFAATFFQSIFICLMTYRLLQTAVANEKKALDAQEAIALKNQELAQINESLESRVLEQTADLRKQTEDLAILAQSSQRIFENIEEGIICFTSDFKVEKASSWAERELNIKVGDDLMPFFARIMANDDQKAATLQGLSLSMGADALQWELNRPQYLQRVQLGNRTLQLDFHPIILDQSVQSVILTAQDKTEEILHKEQEQMADARFLRLIQKARSLMNGGSVSRMFLHESQNLTRNLERLPEAPQAEAQILFRNLHTIKGAARAAQLHDISTLAHHLESLYRERQMSLLATGITALKTEIEEYTLALREVFGSQADKEPPRRLLDCVQALKLGMEEQLGAHSLRLKSLKVFDALDVLPSGMNECLVHAFSNICDHGFILPLRKGAPPREVHLSVAGFYQNQHAVIEIRDNGQGLNWNRIRELCFQQHFVPEQGRPTSDVLFLDGLTTADGVSESSGRGVGLSFIRQVISGLPEGQATILDNDEGPGTLLRIEWAESGQSLSRRAQ
jgi:HPt (histidine-containing phosphotransfer) domain-containing protein